MLRLLFQFTHRDKVWEADNLISHKLQFASICRNCTNENIKFVAYRQISLIPRGASNSCIISLKCVLLLGLIPKQWQISEWWIVRLAMVGSAWFWLVVVVIAVAKADIVAPRNN